MKPVCLAILNHNGIHHLEALLPTAVAVARNHAGECTVVLLDNRSTTGDAGWVRERFPTVEVVVAPTNDFFFSYNWLLAQRGEPFVVLLNNDLRLTPGFLPPLLRHFDAPDVFAVSATSMDWEGRQFTCGPASLRVHHGWYYWPYDAKRQELSHTLFASGGFMAVDRAKFLELGGFNRLFYPAYGEDLDLCFRAWKKGWRCLFEPASLVFHREGGSWSAERGGRGARLGLRAALLFQWSSLPPDAHWLLRTGRSGKSLLTKLLGGQAWYVAEWMRTLRWWIRQRKDFAWMQTQPAELQAIVRRLQAPVG